MSAQRDARSPANSEQVALWDGPAAEHRIRYVDVFDAQLRAHDELFDAATAIGPRDRVLDIGCGTGGSTRAAARAAVDGSVLGVDLSERMLDHARRTSEQEGLRNVTYQYADAQVHAFPQAHFDVALSRFGVMFFHDPVAAFTNIGRALRSRGRLAVLVWQDRELNEWSTIVRDALGTGTSADAPISLAPFSMADPTATEALLTEAGFTDVQFTDVDEPAYYGRDSAAAYDFLVGLRGTQDVLAELDADAADRALRRLRAAIDAHETGDGVLLSTRAWIITAHRS